MEKVFLYPTYDGTSANEVTLKDMSKMTHDKAQQNTNYIYRADSWFAPSQWQTSLQSNAVSHWLGANLESALYICVHNSWDVLFK